MQKTQVVAILRAGSFLHTCWCPHTVSFALSVHLSLTHTHTHFLSPLQGCNWSCDHSSGSPWSLATLGLFPARETKAWRQPDSGSALTPSSPVHSTLVSCLEDTSHGVFLATETDPCQCPCPGCHSQSPRVEGIS